MNDKPKVLIKVERQTGKSYGERCRGKSTMRNSTIRDCSKDVSTVCWQCGKESPVNYFGICETCWMKHIVLRENKIKKREMREDNEYFERMSREGVDD